MIKGLKKNRIVDIILVERDITLLEHRIHNSYEYVNKIILIITPENDVEANFNLRITPWLDKVKVLHVEENQFYHKKNLNKIKTFLKDCEFEDLICFSKINELPDYQNLDVVNEQIIFGPVVLRNTNFILNTTLHSKNRHMGTICINYSQLLDYKTDLNTLDESKQNIITSFFNVVDNGYNFQNFSKNYEIENISINTYKGTINFSKDYLNEIFPQNLCEKKNLVIFNMTQDYIDVSEFDEYSKIFNFNFTKDYKLKNVESIQKLETINIFLPPNPLYETPENLSFNLFFGLQEIQKFLLRLEFLECQKIDFISYPRGNVKSVNEKMIWGNFSDTNFVETFYNQLSEFI